MKQTFNHTGIIDSLYQQKYIELWMIAISNTVTNPKTMMIILKYTSLAFTTMFASIWQQHITFFAQMTNWSNVDISFAFTLYIIICLIIIIIAHMTIMTIMTTITIYIIMHIVLLLLLLYLLILINILILYCLLIII